MNLQRPNSNDVSQTANRSRNVVPGSGLCTRCVDGCRGNCEVFKASFRGREVIYPGPYGVITAGGDKDYPVDYSHLNIQGYAFGAAGLPAGIPADPDHTAFPVVDTETEFGAEHKIKLKVPVFSGALGSTDVAVPRNRSEGPCAGRCPDYHVLHGAPSLLKDSCRRAPEAIQWRRPR